MRVRTRIGIGVASAAILAAVGVGVAVAVADDQEITGPAADQARAAAVQAIPGKAGKVEKETNEGPPITESSSPNPTALKWKYTWTRAFTS